MVERFEPRGGGVEAVAWAVAHELVRAGDEVHVFSRRAEEPEAGAGGTGPTLHPLRVPASWQPLRVLAFSRAAARAARRGVFDAVQSFSRTRHQDVYRAGGGCHAAYMERSYGRAGARLRRLTPRHAVLLGIEEAVFRDASQRVLCNSEMVRDEIRERYDLPVERLPVIPNGVDLERFRPLGPGVRAACRRALGAPDDVPVWLVAGSGFRRKGVDTALRALAAARDPDARLWVAGGDPPAPWQRLAGELGLAARVRFVGPRADLPELYAAADALLLPTRYDAFANVCLEAAACGRPVITSGANGAAGWLGPAALTVDDPEDVAGFAAALDALGDADRRRALGAAARARAEGASWARHVAALRRLYAELPR